MADEWDVAQKRQKEAGGKFLSLKNHNDKFVGAFIGKPKTRDVFFNKKTEKTEDYTAEHKARGDQPQAKFLMNVWMPGDESVKVFEMNAATFGSILACREKYGLEKCFFEVKRNGAKGDTKTTYTCLADADIKPEQLEKIKAAKPHDLETAHTESMSGEDKEKLNGNSLDKPAAAATPAAAPDVVAIADADALTVRAKLLPPEHLNKWLEIIGKERIKGMTKARFKFASDELEKIEIALKPLPAAAAPAAVEDPFA